MNHHLIVRPNFPRSPAALQPMLATCATRCGRVCWLLGAAAAPLISSVDQELCSLKVSRFPSVAFSTLEVSVQLKAATSTHLFFHGQCVSSHFTQSGYSWLHRNSKFMRSMHISQKVEGAATYPKLERQDTRNIHKHLRHQIWVVNSKVYLQPFLKYIKEINMYAYLSAGHKGEHFTGHCQPYLITANRQQWSLWRPSVSGLAMLAVNDSPWR